MCWTRDYDRFTIQIPVAELGWEAAQVEFWKALDLINGAYDVGYSDRVFLYDDEAAFTKACGILTANNINFITEEERV